MTKNLSKGVKIGTASGVKMRPWKWGLPNNKQSEADTKKWVQKWRREAFLFFLARVQFFFRGLRLVCGSLSPNRDSNAAPIHVAGSGSATRSTSHAGAAVLPGAGEQERPAVSDDQSASRSHLAATLRQRVLEAPNVADEIDSLRNQRSDRRKEMNEASKKLRQEGPKLSIEMHSVMCVVHVLRQPSVAAGCASVSGQCDKNVCACA